MKDLKINFFLIPFMAILMCSLSGCNSDDGGDGSGDGPYYMDFKANGTDIHFNEQPFLVAISSISGNQHFNTITGTAGSKTNVGLQIYDDKPLEVATYTGYGVTGGVTVGIIIGYLDPDTGLTFSASGGLSSDVIITITELTDSGVRGTFSGTLVHSGQANIVITEGEFFVRRG